MAVGQATCRAMLTAEADHASGIAWMMTELADYVPQAIIPEQGG
ncbi:MULTISPECIES: hypothetical protein [Bradyrhizobium]|nr:hypothetical protein [Bradyrhizobium ottawaense]